ncbi:MAG: GSCFA domain-containing protein [Candidatus Omnitrophica bacterium]|nr:GSCFA domain-containing protein [Candidatus Omnitrophota bacterium]MDD5237024.1 GSCFA domain-containing protein [Candidatus Omnitrophota bacterium]MDD5611307.1 GSCFA domain-containing protein [Candidatus Omnitrophota bacterium]
MLKILKKIIKKILRKLSLIPEPPPKPPADISLWTRAKDRLVPQAWPQYSSSFKIDKGDKIFTIGSCFARNIEEHLITLGFDVPMLAFKAPKNEWPHRPNGILNKYSPTAIFQELAWCEQIHLKGNEVSFNDIEKLLYPCDNGYYIDMHIDGFVPVSKERALARRQEIYDVFSHAFSCQVCIITLGLVEVWYDLENSLFIQRAPSKEMQPDAKRFKFIRLNYNECYDFIQKAISLIKKYSPQCKFLITTSPVPLTKTFTGQDIIIANTYSKSVLRAVAGEIVAQNTLIDYFPSFENVTLTKDWAIYEKDMIHVDDGFVKKIVEGLIEHYL